jgi:HSP20 family protein
LSFWQIREAWALHGARADGNRKPLSEGDCAMLTNQVNGNRIFTFRPGVGPSRVNGWNETGARAWSPAVDVIETPEAYLIHVDLPGMKAESVSITFERGTLTLQGRREPSWQAPPDGGWRSYTMERLQGDFARSIRLPEHVDVDRIEAHFTDGVLTITAPKGEAAVTRRIPIQTAAASQGH